MEHEFFVSTLFNQLIANPIASLLGVHAEHDVLPAHVVMIILICLGLLAFGLILRSRLSVDNPGNIQQVMELVMEGILGFMKDMIGPGYQRYFPIIGTLFLYILVGNLIGLVPGFMSPTSNINVTAGCAITVFLYYNYQGFRVQGFKGYLAHFAGPVVILAPLLFVIELISHAARPVSLSLRLFGNIYSEELIILNINQLFPFFAALPVLALGLFASTIQAFIFIVLTMVYIGGAVEVHDHHDSGAPEGASSSAHH